MNYKGIVFFDYDGTLADEKENIFLPTKITAEALKKLTDNGYLTVMATGRALCYIPDTGIDFGGYVTSNGSYAQIGKREIFQNFIDRADLTEVIGTLENMGLYYSLENQKKGFAKDKNALIFKNMINNFKIPFEVFEELDLSNMPKASKLLVVYNNMGEHEALQGLYQGRFEISMHRKYLSADIQPAWINKAVGARAIAEHLNIDRDNIYAFGDGTNDYEMFKFAGHAIAMGYHSETLDEVCEYVTDTVANEGICKGLKHFGLI